MIEQRRTVLKKKHSKWRSFLWSIFGSSLHVTILSGLKYSRLSLQSSSCFATYLSGYFPRFRVRAALPSPLLTGAWNNSGRNTALGRTCLTRYVAATWGLSTPESKRHGLWPKGHPLPIGYIIPASCWVSSLVKLGLTLIQILQDSDFSRPQLPGLNFPEEEYFIMLSFVALSLTSAPMGHAYCSSDFLIVARKWSVIIKSLLLQVCGGGNERMWFF